MVYEIIGKITLYIIGTLLFGAFVSSLDNNGDDWGVFFGAWLAGTVVFLGMIVP